MDIDQLEEEHHDREHDENDRYRVGDSDEGSEAF